MKFKFFALNLLLSISAFGFNTGNSITNHEEIKDSLISIKISFTGDLMCHSLQYEYAQTESDSFDFAYPYKYIKKYFAVSDFVVGNFETVTAGKESNYSGYPTFNSPDDYIKALKDVGFNYVSTANNHCLDRSEPGLRRTIQLLDENGINHSGTYFNNNDYDSIRIYNVKGIKIAILPYTYGTNGIHIPSGKDFLVSLINYDRITQQIKLAKLYNPDLIIVHFHFGEEYTREPNQFQKNLVDTALKAGADIIIGGHPHVLQPAEFVKGYNKLDSSFVAYSMGNFISSQDKKYTTAGMILNLNIIKNMNSNKIFISKADVIPTYVYKGDTGNKNQFLILPLNEKSSYKLNFINLTEKIKMKEAYEDTKYILNKYDKRIIVR